MRIFKRNKIFYAVALFSVSTAFLLSSYQKRSEIDIETVRKDLLLSGKEWIPLRKIEKLKVSMFNPIYTNDFCFVHLPYKDYSGGNFMKPSVVAVYLYEDNT
jgi:hypothetical protein